MNTIEFKASIQNGIVQIPKEYQELYNQKSVQIFIIAANTTQPKSKIKFGLAKGRVTFFDDIMAEDREINSMFYGE
ncbi:MAG: hypothetical protein K0U38_11205 [Epsilonproteobacteria bacterium]|nr:hypothetical protein [Campylobacterota bacterium]